MIEYKELKDVMYYKQRLDDKRVLVNLVVALVDKGVLSRADALALAGLSEPDAEKA